MNQALEETMRFHNPLIAEETLLSVHQVRHEKTTILELIASSQCSSARKTAICSAGHNGVVKKYQLN